MIVLQHGQVEVAQIAFDFLHRPLDLTWLQMGNEYGAGLFQPTQLFLEESPVIKTGQCIMQAEVLQLAFHLGAFGDIAADGQHFVIAAGGKPRFVILGRTIGGDLVLENLH